MGGGASVLKKRVVVVRLDERARLAARRPRRHRRARKVDDRRRPLADMIVGGAHAEGAGRARVGEAREALLQHIGDHSAAGLRYVREVPQRRAVGHGDPLMNLRCRDARSQ